MANIAIADAGTLEYGMSFVFRVPTDSDSFKDIKDASSSFRADL